MTALAETQSRELTRRIAAYRQRFGEGHFYLACHAALPLALTPDLLYRLWANFQSDRHDADLNIPWIAVSDLLLSGLCEEVGFELYEMDASVRETLLKQLSFDPNFGLDRVRELADFLITYIEPQLDSLDPDIQDFATAQKWSALACKNPHEAACTIATSLAQLNQNDTTECIRMAALLEALEEPLVEYRSLITYAQAIADFSRGDLEDAVHLLNQILTAANQLQIAQVDLPIPEVLKARLAALQVSESQQSRPRIEFLRQYRWLISGGITGSLALASGVFYLSQGNRSPQPIPSVVSAAPSPQVTQSVTPSPQPSATPSVNPESPLNSTPSPSPTSRSTAESTPASSLTIPLPSPSTTALPQSTASPNSSTDVLSSQPTNQPESLQSLPTLNSPDTNLLPPPPLPEERIFPAPVTNSSAGLNTPSTENTPLRSENKPLRSAIGLKIGDSSAMVEELQRRLTDLGYFSAAPTGYFGPITQDAVIRLQRDKGLPETGIIDSSTLSHLSVRIGGGKSETVNRYYVMIPKQSATTLAQVRRYFPNAVEVKSELGDYVEAGPYPNVERADRQANLLRARGFDARVDYR